MNTRFAYEIKVGDTILALDTSLGVATLDRPILVASTMEHKRIVGTHYTISGEALGKAIFWTCTDYDVYYVAEVSK